MKNDILIDVENVSKKFCRSLKKSLWYGLCDVAAELNPIPRTRAKSGVLGVGELRAEEFWAVDNVSFKLRRGECLGLIGRNGAGKTTLLKMLNGLIKPDRGCVEMRGRVGALIALGAGFNPVLTGRENAYVNASVLGLSKHEIDGKLDGIIEFAELREFIDSPVQSYSSGMQVRLGFAVATALNPDILILDEVLAVGDVSFRNRCYNRISELRKKAAVIFVSHNIEQVSRICDRALVLAHGKVAYQGSPNEGVSIYERLNENAIDEEGASLTLYPPITTFAIDLESNSITSGDALRFHVHIESQAVIMDPLFRMTVYSASGAIAAECTMLPQQHGMNLPSGLSELEICIGSVPLKNGRYILGFNVFNSVGDILTWSYKQYTLEVHGAFPGSNSDCQLVLQSCRSTENTTGN